MQKIVIMEWHKLKMLVLLRIFEKDTETADNCDASDRSGAFSCFGIPFKKASYLKPARCLFPSLQHTLQDTEPAPGILK